MSTSMIKLPDQEDALQMLADSQAENARLTAEIAQLKKSGAKNSEATNATNDASAPTAAATGGSELTATEAGMVERLKFLDAERSAIVSKLVNKVDASKLTVTQQCLLAKGRDINEKVFVQSSAAR